MINTRNKIKEDLKEYFKQKKSIDPKSIADHLRNFLINKDIYQVKAKHFGPDSNNLENFYVPSIYLNEIFSNFFGSIVKFKYVFIYLYSNLRINEKVFCENNFGETERIILEEIIKISKNDFYSTDIILEKLDHELSYEIKTSKMFRNFVYCYDNMKNYDLTEYEELVKKINLENVYSIFRCYIINEIFERSKLFTYCGSVGDLFVTQMPNNKNNETDEKTENIFFTLDEINKRLFSGMVMLNNLIYWYKKTSYIIDVISFLNIRNIFIGFRNNDIIFSERSMNNLIHLAKELKEREN